MTTTTKAGSEYTTATMSVHKRQVLTDDGVTITYTVRGDGPRTLLFLHGWGGSGSGFFWNEMLTHLDLISLRVILADLRNHGDSDQVTTGFTTDRFAQDVWAVADDAAAETVVLVGYSVHVERWRGPGADREGATAGGIIRPRAGDTTRTRPADEGLLSLARHTYHGLKPQRQPEPQGGVRSWHGLIRSQRGSTGSVRWVRGISNSISS